MKQTSSTSIPSPTGGWNARDSLAEMDEIDAVTLVNWFPDTSEVILRKGFSNHVTGVGDQVESLMAFNSASTNKLFGVAGGSIYDMTSAGAVGAASVSGLNNSRFQYINISTASGSFLMSVNGADKLQGFDGTSWYVDGDGSHDITGVDTADIIHINLFKTRVWLVEKETLKVWYLATNAISGAATAIDFRSIAKRGGYLMAMGTWTIDAGYGVDDLAVFITSEGEVIVYRGTDPSSANTWALVGVWQLGAPIGRRCLIKYAGDLLLVCQDGVVPLSSALQSSRVNPMVALTDKIKKAMNSAAVNYGSNFGWQMLFYPKGNMLFLNVPVEAGDNQEQYVMNTINKSWCRFNGWNANCWEIFGDEPYFGSDGFVGKGWSTLSDSNTDISGTAKQAFSYFGSPGRQKRFTLMRPIFLTNGSPSIYANINVDFQDTIPIAMLVASPIQYASWDGALWDTDVWGGDVEVLKSWQGVNGIGFCAAPTLQVASQGIEVRWTATDLMMEKGGVL